MYDIVSIGGAAFDLFLKSSHFPLEMKDVGGKIEVEEILSCSGGGGTNTAAGFSRLGLKAACVARFGDDLFGKFLLEDLKTESFDKKYLIEKKGDRTDYSSILVNPDGSRIILVCRGQTRVDEKVFPWSVLEETRWLYLASIEGNVSLLEKIVNQAVEKEIKVVLNPGNRELRESDTLLRLFPKLEALILNKEEADLFGLNKLSKQGPKILAITYGRQGARVFSREQDLFATAFLANTIDETGAGDAFSSGFVTGLVKGLSLKEALKMGMSNGASVVGQMGGKAGLLCESEMAVWMEKRLMIDENKYPLPSFQ